MSGRKAATTLLLAVGLGLSNAATAVADDVVPDPASPGPVVQVAGAPTADNADPVAVQACAQFAQVLPDGSATYYGDFADSYEGSGYAVTRRSPPAMSPAAPRCASEAAELLDECGQYPEAGPRYRGADAGHGRSARRSCC